MKSGFTAVLIPSRTTDRDSVQLVFSWAFNELFKTLWKRSKKPVDLGWKDVVQIRFVWKNFVSSLKRSDSSCRPWSVVIVTGQPNRDIQLRKTTRHTNSAFTSAKRLPLATWVYLPMMARQYSFHLMEVKGQINVNVDEHSMSQGESTLF